MATILTMSGRFTGEPTTTQTAYLDDKPAKGRQHFTSHTEFEAAANKGKFTHELNEPIRQLRYFFDNDDDPNSNIKISGKSR